MKSICSLPWIGSVSNLQAKAPYNNFVAKINSIISDGVVTTVEAADLIRQAHKETEKSRSGTHAPDGMVNRECSGECCNQEYEANFAVIVSQDVWLIESISKIKRIDM